MVDAFVSYSRRDQAVVERLDAALTEAGLDVFVDYDDIPPSFDWLEVIKDGIDRASAVVCVVTPDYLESEVCGIELRLAEEAGKRLVPIVLGDVPGDAVAPALRPLNWILADAADDLDGTAELVSTAVRADPVWTAAHTRLLLRARDWDRAGRRRSGLLRGQELRAAEAALAVERALGQPLPTRLQREFVAASRRAAGRRRMIAGVAGAVLLVVLGVGLVRLQVTGERAERGESAAQSRELAALALDHLEDDHDLALLLAVEAVRAADTRESYGALLRTALHTPAVERHLHGFAGQIRGAAFVDDGATLVAGGEGGALAAWSVADGGQVVSVPPVDVSILDVAAAADGTVATAHSDGTVRLWDATGGMTTTSTVRVDDLTEVRSLAFSPDGRLLASGTARGRVVVSRVGVDLEPGTVVLERPEGVGQLRWAPDGRRIAVVHGDALDVIVGAGGHELLATVAVPNATTVAWAPDGSSIAVGDSDGTIQLFRLTAGGQLSPAADWRTRTPHDAPVSALVHAPDGSLLSADLDGTIRAWDPDRSEEPVTERVVHATRVTALASDGGSRLASVGTDGSVVVWNDDPTSGLARPVEEYHGVSSLTGESWRSTTAAGHVDGRVVVTDHAAGAPVVELPGSGDAITAIALAGRGDTVITGSDGGVVARWSVAEPESGPLVLDRRPARITTVAAGAEGRLVSWGDGDGAVTLYDAEDDAVLAADVIVPLGVLDVAFRPAGDELVVAGATTEVLRLGTTDLGPIATLGGVHTDWVDAAAYSPDGDALVTASTEDVVVWELATGGRTMLTDAHDARITAIGFDPDGSVMATGDVSGGLVLWDPRSDWQPLNVKIATPLTSGVEEITFLPSWTVVVFGWGDDPVIYDLGLDSLRRVACSTANRELTAQERARFTIDGDDPCASPPAGE